MTASSKHYAPATSISERRVRRAASRADVTQLQSGERLALELPGAAIGTVERTFGLMKRDEIIVVGDVVAVSGDLAVADRLAVVAAAQRREPIVVLEIEGWFVACSTDRALHTRDLELMEPVLNEEGHPQLRIMSLVNEHGIKPALGPLVA